MRVSIISAVVGLTAFVSAAPVAMGVAGREAAPQYGTYFDPETWF